MCADLKNLESRSTKHQIDEYLSPGEVDLEVNTEQEVSMGSITPREVQVSRRFFQCKNKWRISVLERSAESETLV